MMRIVHALAFASTIALAAPALLLAPASPARAAMPVFDPTNYAQNLLQAARALEQVNNQVRSLQNETDMLRSLGKHLERIDFPELGRVKVAMERIDGLMGQARGIGFQVDRLDEQFRAMFPGGAGRALGSDARVAEARTRLDAAMAGFRHSMAVQAQVAENVRGDAALLGDIVARSQDSVGSLQVSQATNQLLALSTKQQLQLQAMMAAEFRSIGHERARRAQAESEARAATRRFLGSGRAYTPQ